MAGDLKAKLTLQADVLGSDELLALADDVRNLGGDARQAGPALGALAAELERASRNASGGLKESLAAAAAEMRRLESEATKADDKLARMRGSSDSLGEALKRAGAIIAGGFTAREFVQAAADMEKLQAGLQAVTGDAGKAREAIEFVRGIATRAGVDAVAAGSAYLGLAAATKGTAVEGRATREVFEAVSVSMARAGKSSEETRNALVALQQIAGKGVVSMEEMRGQLGEALPGALQAAAAGLGVTTQDLNKLIESGQLAAEDLFPALTKGLADLYGGAPAAQTLSQEIVNIKNAFLEMAANIGDAGGLGVLKFGAEAAQAAIVLLDATLVSVGKTLGVLAGAVRSLDFSGVAAAFGEIEREANDKLLKAAQHNQVLAGMIDGLGDAQLRAGLAAQQQAAAAEQAAAATEKAGAAAAASAPSYAALSSAYEAVKMELSAQVELAAKQVAAVQARGDAAVAEAKLLGDEVALRKAVGLAAADEAAAMQELAQKRQTEVDVLVAELDNKRAALAAAGAISDQRKKELADLEQLIQKKQIEADRTRAQAAEARALARAKGEEAQAAEAAVQAARASAVARKGESDAAIALLETQRGLARQSEELARMMGDEQSARSYRIQQLEIDIRITRAKADAMRAEAEGSIAVAQAALEELRAKGELTAVKEAELNASIKLANAKLKEADAVRQSARLTQQAIDNVRQYGDAAGRAGAASRAATDGAGGGWRKVADAARDAAGAAEEYKQKVAEGVERVGAGFRNKDGFSSDAMGNIFSFVESQAELNQRVAKLFGEAAIGNREAIDAANIKLKLDAAAKNGVHASAQAYFDALQKEYQRLYEKLMGGGAAAGGVAPPGRKLDLPAPRPQREESSGGSGGVSAGAAAGAPVNITLNVNGVNDPARLAKLIEPELARLGRLAR